MYTYPVSVEFEDVDSYGIAHHTKIISYFERARVHFFSDNGIDVKTIKHGLILVNLNVNFKLPLILLEKVDVELRVKSIEKIRFVWDYTIKKNDKIAVKAEVEQAVIDLETKRLVMIPDEIRILLEKILIKE